MCWREYVYMFCWANRIALTQNDGIMGSEIASWFVYSWRRARVQTIDCIFGCNLIVFFGEI